MKVNIETDYHSGHSQAANNNEKTSQGHDVLEVSQQLLSSNDSMLLILLLALLKSVLDIYPIFCWMDNVSDKLESIILSLKNIVINNDGDTSTTSHSNEARIIHTHIDSGLNISLFSYFKTKLLVIPQQKIKQMLATLPCRFDLQHGATFGILFCIFRI